MDILLINPDHNNKVNNFPWGVLSVGSYLRNVKNYDVKMLDMSIYSLAEFYQELKYFCNETKLVGLYCMSTDVCSVKTIIDYIKKINKNCKIIIGGPHTVLYPEQTCLYKNIDFVAYTEGELTLSFLIDEIKSGRHKYDSVPGLIYKERNYLKKTTCPESVGFYDINYELLSESVQRSLHDYIQVLTGRGCSFRCTFCFVSVNRQKWRGRPMYEVISEIEKLVNKYDPKVIYFRDENFFHSKERIEEFISYYKDRKFNFRWRATCRASYYRKGYIDYDFLKELESINCETLKFGIESGSQRVLNYIKKGIRVENVKRLARDLSKVKNIQGNYSFMIGLPGEIYEEYKETLNLIKYIYRHEPTAMVIGPQYFLIYPGGVLYEEIKNKYNFYQPNSFEEWFKMLLPENRKDNFIKESLFNYLHINYPWIPKKDRFLAQHAEVLVSLYMLNIKEYLKLKTIGELIFILLAKFRFKIRWFNYLYDIRAAVFLKNLRDKFLKSRSDAKKGVTRGDE